MNKLPIYKITSKRILKMVEDVDYLDCRDYIVDLSNQLITYKVYFDTLLTGPDGLVMFTELKSRVNDYQERIKRKEWKSTVKSGKKKKCVNKNIEDKIFNYVYLDILELSDYGDEIILTNFGREFVEKYMKEEGVG